MVARWVPAVLAALLLVAPGGAAWAAEEDAAEKTASPAEAPEAQAEAAAPAAEEAAAETPSAPEEAAAETAAADPEEEDAPALTPYYDFSLSEGLSLPSIGNFFFGSNMGSTVGGQVGVAEGHNIFGVYTLEYSGPGIRSEDDQEFAERTLDHSFGLGHEWRLAEPYALKTRVTFLNEFRRSGANEPFGEGLYDFWSLGIDEEFAASVGGGVVASLGIGVSWVGFPNYTDLLNEFQMAGTGAETAGGKNDYTRIHVSPEARYKNLAKAYISWSMQSFRNAKVLTEQGTYGTETQKDGMFALGASGALRLTPADSGFPGVVSTDPQLDVSFKSSNQNFLRFAGFGAASFDFVEDNYSYTKYELKSPLRWTFGGKTALFFVPGVIYKRYASRPPRNADGVYQHEGNNPNQPAKQQWNQTFLLSWGLTWPRHRFSSWTLAYTWYHQKSNNHFERYLPYNFSGHIISATLNVAY